jgi:predicted AlkP superfamily phosphohydrolase/phosphomutase
LTFFDLEKTQAYAVLASTNGINIQVRGQKGPHGIAPEDYESFRSELIDALLTRCVDPVTSDPIVKRVWTREEAFSGSAMDLAPDLTLELRDFGFFSVLRGASVLKKRPVVMGTHHPSGIFAACGPGIRAGARLDAMDLLDVAPTVLHLLGQPIPDDLEGRMGAEAFTEEFLRSRKVQHSTAARQAQAPSQTETDEGYQDAESQEQIMMRLKALGYIE